MLLETKAHVKGVHHHSVTSLVDEHGARSSVALRDVGSKDEGLQKRAEPNEGPVLERRPSESIAPYQALPIVGLITRHLTAALPVLEPGENAEVGKAIRRKSQVYLHG